MIRHLTAAERGELVARIAARMAEFDDAALEELDRVTDEARYAAGEVPGGGAGPLTEPPPLTRRQLLAGGALLTLASLGTALAVRGAWPALWCP